MKVAVLICLILTGVISYLLYGVDRNYSKVASRITDTLPSPTATTQRSVLSATSQESKALFVPYWGIGNEKISRDSYDEIYYFGISVNKDGVDKKDPGFIKIGNFLNLVDPQIKKFLTVRMVNPDVNSYVLQNKVLQEIIRNESMQIAKENLFDGIILDFETAALSFDSLTERINLFYESFYKEAKEKNLSFYITLYGDTFYRARPYDVEYLSKNSDKIIIMTYDFHKARGNPGPNFPLSGLEKYGYDLKTMINDFLRIVPQDKISVVFGMFGYDWVVDEKDTAQNLAEATSLNSVKKTLESCQQEVCGIKRDDVSSETEVRYKDKDLNQHIIWFEDMESVEKKKEYLREKGINSFGFWAYSYF